MRETYSWLYMDYKEKIWKFFINENSELVYKIKNREEKWTKGNYIDRKVTEFDLFLDENEGFHIVYSNVKGELRYCTLKEKQWFGKVLYKIESKNYNIENINIKLLESKMHIFFVLVSNDGSDHGVLMHCIWDGNNFEINKIQDLILKSDVKEYYKININDKDEIHLFYLSDEGDELSLNYSIYKENNWSASRRLYGIKGEEIQFEVEINKSNIHIINKSKENFKYYLDHVVIEKVNVIKNYNLYTGENELKDPIIIKEKNKVYACWLEDNKIYYSSYNSTEWDKPTKLIDENTNNIRVYNSYISNNRTSFINKIKIYGTDEGELKLYSPVDFGINNKKDSFNSSEVKNNKIDDNSVNSELYKLREENKVLEDKVTNLSLMLENNQKVIEDYTEQIIIALEEKRKAEQDSKNFLELQEKLKKEYETLLKEIALLKEENINIKSKVEE